MSGPRNGPDRWSAVLVLAVSLWFVEPAAGQARTKPARRPAQADEAGANAEAPETPSSLPHGRFLLDYLIVLALFAAALYAVCRSSRRV